MDHEQQDYWNSALGYLERIAKAQERIADVAEKALEQRIADSAKHDARMEALGA